MWEIDHQNSGGSYTFLLIFGSVVFGFGFGMYCTPLMPEIIDAVENDLKNQGARYDSEELFNVTSGYFIMFMSLG